MKQQNTETPNLDAIMSSHTAKNAELITNVGKWSTIILNAATSYAFGYAFAPLFASGVMVGTLRLDGILGGVSCLLLTDGMARIWDIARSQASKSPAQQKIGKAGYLISFVASIVMTLIYLSVAIFGSTPASAEGFVIVGRTIFTLLAVVQLILFALYEQRDPKYTERLIRTTSRAAVRDQILEMEATALLKTAQLVKGQLGDYVAPHAEQITKDIVAASLAQLGYEPSRLVHLPSKTLAEIDSAETPPPDQPAESATPKLLDAESARQLVETLLMVIGGKSAETPQSESDFFAPRPHTNGHPS